MILTATAIIYNKRYNSTNIFSNTWRGRWTGSLKVWWSAFLFNKDKCLWMKLQIWKISGPMFLCRCHLWLVTMVKWVTVTYLSTFTLYYPLCAFSERLWSSFYNADYLKAQVTPQDCCLANLHCSCTETELLCVATYTRKLYVFYFLLYINIKPKLMSFFNYFWNNDL